MTSLAPEGVILSSSFWGRGLWNQDLKLLEISAWHVLRWKATQPGGNAFMDVTWPREPNECYIPIFDPLEEIEHLEEWGIHR